MKLPSTSRLATALGGIVALVLAVAPAAHVVTFTTTEFTDVSLAGAATVALIASAIGHFRRDTAPEPVILSYAITAALSAWFVVGNAFGWWALDAAAQTRILAAIIVIFGGGGQAVARGVVTPIKVRLK